MTWGTYYYVSRTMTISPRCSILELKEEKKHTILSNIIKQYAFNINYNINHLKNYA